MSEVAATSARSLATGRVDQRHSLKYQIYKGVPAEAPEAITCQIPLGRPGLDQGGDGLKNNIFRRLRRTIAAAQAAVQIPEE